jgi:uncharacterized protein YcnI
MKFPAIALLCLALVSVPAGFGHVTVTPVRSSKAVTETYTFRIPSEGGRTTTGLVLQVPPGVTVLSVAVPKDGGSVAYVRKSAGQPDEIVWTVEIKPAGVVQLTLTAANAPEDGAMTWKVTQKYADGTTGDWTPKTTLGAIDDEPAPAAPAAGAPRSGEKK